MQLCKDTEISEISVSGLTDKAQINRTTFYLHFQRVTDVMKDIERDVEIKISAYVDKIDINSVYESSYATFTHLTDKLNENPALRDYIFDSTSSQNTLAKLKRIITEKSITAVQEVYPTLTEEKVKFPLTFLISGIVDTYFNWIHSDKTVSHDEVIKIISQLTRQTLNYISTLK